MLKIKTNHLFIFTEIEAKVKPDCCAVSQNQLECLLEYIRKFHG